MAWAWALLAAAVFGQLLLLAAAWWTDKTGGRVSLRVRTLWSVFAGLGIIASAGLSDPLLVIAQVAILISVWRAKPQSD